MTYKPDGSGTVIINICNSDGELISTEYKNLSEIAHLEETTTEKQ